MHNILYYNLIYTKNQPKFVGYTNANQTISLIENSQLIDSYL